ncbi:hypothetical protein [Sorangium sp. So ce341]|uniref:hypothetical protein n=1 Tax=Sorangium sp. So ce341 TaxID=3133302 RepID=UPI003F628E0E
MSGAEEPVVVELKAPLALEAAAAQQALAGLAAGTAVVWRVPAGSHALPGELVWGAAGIDLSVVGAPDAVLEVSGVGLRIEGRAVRVERLGLEVAAAAVVKVAAVDLARVSDLRGEGGALAVKAREVAVEDVRWRDADGAGAAEEVGIDLEGDVVDVAGVQVAMRGTGSVPRVGVLVTGRERVAAGDVLVQGVRAPRAVGLEVAGAEVVLAGADVRDVVATAATGAAGFPGVGAVDAIGVTVEAAGGLDASRVASRAIDGAAAIGVRIVSGAVDGGAAAEEAAGGESGVAGLDALDVRAEDVTGQAAAIGVLAVSRGGTRARGVTATRVRAERAAGLLVRAGTRLDLSVAHVQEVLGSAGAAVGARLCVADPTARAVVQDVLVSQVGRAVFGGGGGGGTPPDGEPPAAWEAWATAPVAAAGGARPRRGDTDAAAWPAAAPDVTGLCVLAPATPLDVVEVAAPAVRVTDSAVRRVGGLALRVVGRLRPAIVRRMELLQSARAAYVQGEEALVAEATLHAHRTGLRLGAGLASLANVLISGIAEGPSVELGADAELAGAAMVLAAPTGAAELPEISPLGPLPYRSPGSATAPASAVAGDVPPEEAWDLRLAADAAILARPPARVPGDDEGTSFLGAHAPEASAPCDARDPLRLPVEPAPAAPEPAPLANYLARDAEGLLELMLDRARVTMQPWTERGAADQTTMLFELLADRLDLLAQKQERAVAEGYLDTAQLRRSVEDHARALDCPADPGLSATAMIRFRFDLDAAPAARRPAFAEGVSIPAGTLVGNRGSDEAGLVFATEAPLLWLAGLDELALAEDAPAGATEAAFVSHPGFGDREERALLGRWLVLREAHATGHVVRITEVSAGPDRVRVSWDPRRPLPRPLRAVAGADGEAATALGNVVPAHHGVPLVALGADDDAQDRLLGRYRRLLTLEHDGREREVALPFSPVSVQAEGYPFPGEARAGTPTRTGTPRVAVSVEGVPWPLVDDLSLAGATDRVCVLRAGRAGGQALRFGDERNGARLPARKVPLDLSMSVGLGAVGNVGAERLATLLAWGRPAGGRPTLPELLTDAPGPDRDDLVRAVLSVSNPLPAVGGRDPERLADLRDRAPRVVSDARSAVTLADYERLSRALPEVAAARAELSDRPVAPCVRVTALLRDDDTLAPAERLRRWALVRRRLEDVRLLGFDVEVLPPRWVPLDLDVAVDAADLAEAGAVRDGVWSALAGQGGLFDPDTSGLGGAVHLSAVYRALLGVPGVVAARVLRFRRLVPNAPERLEEGVIPMSGDEVPILRNPHGGPEEGVLTVTVCGGLR